MKLICNACQETVPISLIQPHLILCEVRSNDCDGYATSAPPNKLWVAKIFKKSSDPSLQYHYSLFVLRIAKDRSGTYPASGELAGPYLFDFPTFEDLLWHVRKTLEEHGLYS